MAAITYEHATVMLHFFRVVSWAGEPRSREGQALAWQRLDQPMAEPMLPANAPVLASLALPLEYAITDARTLGAAEQLARVEAGLVVDRHRPRVVRGEPVVEPERVGEPRVRL